MQPIRGIVPGGPVRRRWSTARIEAAAWLAVTALIVATIASLFIVHIPYFQISPGPTAAVDGLIKVPPAHHHQVKGSILLTTVYQTPAHPIDFLLSWARPDDELVSSRDVLGNLPPDELVKIEEAEMSASQQTAEVVALRRLGYKVDEHGTGAEISEVVPRTPASGVLHAGDTITAIQGRPVATETDAASILQHLAPGTRVAVTVQDSARRSRTVSVVLATRPQHPGQGFLGVGLFTRGERFDLPFPVSISSDGIGGPSAGLAFTLGIIDELTGGRLTGGRTVAATGTMSLDGTVGDVGGVAQKTVSVRDAGATLFLVPPEEYSVARAHAGSRMKVVKVGTINQALAAIAASGGDLTGIPAG